MWILDLCIRALGCRQNTLAASGGAGTFANSRVQNFSSPANKRDANSCGTSANYRSLFILNYYNVHIYIWYMHVFVHVYAMIITIEICFYIFIHNQDCPHMSCFLVECKCQCVFFWCLDPIYVASVFLHMDISSMRSPPVDCVAHHRGSLLFCRGAVGAAMGGLLPASFAIVGDMYPPEERPHAIAMMAAAWLIFLFHLKT